MRALLSSIAVAAVVLMSWAPGTTHASTTFTVNSTADAVDADVNDHVCSTSTPGECTLRAAIQQANASGGGQIIIPAATYVLSIPGVNEDAAASGDLDVNVPLTIRGEGATNTIIDAGGLDRVFDIAPAVTSGSPIVEIDDLTVRNGSCFLCEGGGVLNRGAQLSIQRVVLSHNQAVAGGGLGNLATPNNSAHVELFASTVDGNTANSGGGISNHHIMELGGSTITDNNGEGLLGEGGGIDNDGTLRVFFSVISGNSAMSLGGGLSNAARGLAEVDSTSISSNTAHSGGGIFNSGEVLLTDASTVQGNNAFMGGGIYNGPGAPAGQAGVYVQGSSVIDNKSVFGGGGIANEATVQIVAGSRIEGNEDMTLGGGIDALGASLTRVADSTVAHNKSGLGGGVLAAGGEFDLQNATVYANTATNGGGVYVSAGTEAGRLFAATNSTISGNSATGDGGGVGGEGYPYVRLFSTMVTANVADSDGDGHGDGGGMFAAGNLFQLGDTILAANLDRGNEAPDCSGSFFSAGYNLVEIERGCQINGDLHSNIVGSDPGLLPLADNGGPTQTHKLAAGSPAIDVGNPVTNPCPFADQRGVIRPLDGNGDGVASCDIGSFELAASIVAPTPTVVAGTSTFTPSPTKTSTPTNTPTRTSTFTPTPTNTPARTSTFTPTPTNTSTLTPTPTNTPPPAVVKVPEGNANNTNQSVPAANLWLCIVGPCAGPGEGNLLVTEHASNVHTGDQNGDTIEDGLGAYEFSVEYDNFVIQSVNPCDVVFSPGGAGAARGNVTQLASSAGCATNPTPINGQCTQSLILENIIHFGCVTLGQVAGPTGDFDIARLNLIPHPDLRNDIFPGNDNGVLTVIKDNGCELVDVFGHAITGSVNGGLTPVCGDLASRCASSKATSTSTAPSM